jgi:hypothetical protein
MIDSLYNKDEAFALHRFFVYLMKGAHHQLDGGG